MPVDGAFNADPVAGLADAKEGGVEDAVDDNAVMLHP